MVKKVFHMYSDPGHGWLKVEVSRVRKLGIIDQITPYSYASKDMRWLFLEEDCDAPLFVRTYQEKHGVKLKIHDHYVNRESRIRSYPNIPHASYWEWADKR